MLCKWGVAYVKRNSVYISATGDVRIGGIPNSTYKLNITGSLNATTIYQNGSLIDLTNLSYLISTPGTITASKAVIVDSNKDISGFRSIYSSNSTAYTPLTLTQGTASVSIQMNNLSYQSIGTTSAHGIALMTSNNNAMYISATGDIGIGGTPTSSYKLYVAGPINGAAYYLNGSYLDFSNLSYLTSSPGTISASKAVIVDSNKDIRGFRSIYSVNSTAYTPLTMTQTGGVSVALQLNSAGYSYWGPTSAHNFAIQTSNSGAIFIQANGNVDIGSSTLKNYKLNVSGALNCQSLSIGGVAFNPSATTYTNILVDKIALNQNTPTATKWYAFTNSATPQTVMRWDSSGITDDTLGSIIAETSLGNFSVQQKWQEALLLI